MFRDGKPERDILNAPNWSRRNMLKVTGAGAGIAGLGGVGAASADDNNDDDDDDGDDDDNGDNGDDIVKQSADIVGQGIDGDVVAEDGARLWRTDMGIVLEVEMPTPTPGEYTYPSEPADKEGEWWTDEEGDLEAFTLWGFIFNNPDECDDDCGSDDLGGAAGGGVFSVAGHVFDGDTLKLSGFVTKATQPFVVEGDALGVPLDRPMEAEVHLAVAPHGAFKADMLPEQLQTPASPPAVWWVALFDPPD